MRIAVVNETSTADKNGEILAALEGRGHETINAGMTKSASKPELQYIHAGLMSALLLYFEAADLVVGGCGTGVGYSNSVMQYPGVVCGLIRTPLDAWLFAQINDGNCISLALHQGYGWAGNINLGFIFDQYFSVEHGRGYPERRREPQAASRELLKKISAVAHQDMAGILSGLPEEVAKPVIEYPGFLDLLDRYACHDRNLIEVLKNKSA